MIFMYLLNNDNDLYHTYLKQVILEILAYKSRASFFKGDMIIVVGSPTKERLEELFAFYY